MRELKILEPNAIAAYKDADDNGKTLLTRLFGDAVFNQKITARVKTFEDALIIAGICLKAFDISCSGLSTDEVAFRKLKLVVQVLNEGWTPDWENGSQYKYYPFFKLQGGFSFIGVDNNYQNSNVGSRLCFVDRETAEYVATTFLDLEAKVGKNSVPAE